jgi:hypothetical protein
VDLWNRTDCCQANLSNFDLLWSQDGLSWSSIYYPGQAPQRTTFAVNAQGRYVKVKLRGTNYLSPAEVQVWVCNPPATLTPTPVCPGAGTNLAAAANGGSIAAYSSNFGSPWDVTKLIDGTSTNGWSSGLGTATNEYVTVQLSGGSTYSINRVRINPASTQGDPPYYNMRDFQIRVSTTTTNTASFTTVFTGTVPQFDAYFEYTFPRVQAKYVMLYILNSYGSTDYVEAAEFEVYAACASTVTPTPTRTNTPTFTPTSPALLVGHVTWQGRPAQPNALQQLPITLTLRSASTEVNYSMQTTDVSGFFTVPVAGLANGSYTWRVKSGQVGATPFDYNPGYLAVSGTLTLTGASITTQEMGLQRSGDCNNDNLVSAPDFVLLKNAFGKSVGQPGYDNRADFTGDQLVTSGDFVQLKNNFGFSGAPPIRP